MGQKFTEASDPFGTMCWLVFVLESAKGAGKGGPFWVALYLMVRRNSHP